MHSAIFAGYHKLNFVIVSLWFSKSFFIQKSSADQTLPMCTTSSVLLQEKQMNHSHNAIHFLKNKSEYNRNYMNFTSME